MPRAWACQIPFVGEGNLFHDNFAPDIFQFFCVRLILNSRLGAHYIHKTLQSRKTVGEHFREAGKLSHGTDKGSNVQVEGDQIPVIHLALHDVVSSKAHHDHIEAAQEELNRAVELAHGFMKVPFGGFKSFVGSVEPAAFRLLVGKGLGSANAGEATLYFLIDVANFFLGSCGGTAHPLAHGHDNDQEHRDGQSHHQSQLPPDGTHHTQGTDNGQHTGQQVFRAMVGQLCQFKQVRSQSCHQLTGSVLVVKVEAQLLHMGKKILADVCFHPDTEGMAVIGHDKIQTGPEYIAAHYHCHDGKEGTVHLVGQHIIQGASGNQGKGQIDGCDAHGAANVQGKQFLMVFEILQKNQQRGFFPIVFGCHWHNPPFLSIIIQFFRGRINCRSSETEKFVI